MPNITVLRNDMILRGGEFYKNYKFTSGHEVPMYNISSIDALSQIIGYAKFLNADYGDVFYRGQPQIYDTLLPGICRQADMSVMAREHELNAAVHRAFSCGEFVKFAKLPENSVGEQLIEAVFQHYGVATHYIDLVDNHWIALWFGLYKASSINDGDTFVRYTKRRIDIAGCSVGNHLASCEENYQYLILLAVDNNSRKQVIKSVRYGDRTVSINLRNALPSLFLRPHSQHGYVVKKRVVSGYDFDLSTEVVGILRMRIDCVSEWLGNGLLTSVNSIFPEPAADYAYRVLLKHKDFFEGTDIRIPYNV